MAGTKLSSSAILLLPALLLVGGCTDAYSDIYEDFDHEGDTFFSQLEWDRIESMAGMPPLPASPTNAYADDESAARFGQLLFFDERYSPPDSDGGVSCATCHDPTVWFTRNDPEEDASRNITSVLNIAYNSTYTWNGKRDSLWSLALTPAEGFLKSNRLRIAHHIASEYREQYECVFGLEHDEDQRFFDRVDDFPDGVLDPPGTWRVDQFNPLPAEDEDVVNRIFANFGKAQAAYMRHIVSGPSTFDEYVENRESDDEAWEPWGALSESEKRGLKLFVGGRANCSACHEGQLFTDDEFHNIAVPVEREPAKDRIKGLGELATWEFSVDSPYSNDPTTPSMVAEPTDDDSGAYRTPSLRNISKTGRYMHAGQFATLREVIEHYNDPPEAEDGTRARELWPIELTENEMEDLEAFLRTLAATEPLADSWTSLPPDPPTQVAFVCGE